ncbi:hypothetical protein AG1IA_05332 [Rhizoctonia solani AG-1 IA]|uniref:Uncharacterized protein n=1 Tax=Thanatephorus cucumeris (strain AG1-IA) TaxID=983506 RepID=L8WWA8_THACA|nr:hypothetical protein AG1IA_05332 [Rhizoctonia solani AG-1 IA]
MNAGSGNALREKVVQELFHFFLRIRRLVFPGQIISYVDELPDARLLGVYSGELLLPFPFPVSWPRANRPTQSHPFGPFGTQEAPVNRN